MNELDERVGYWPPTQSHHPYAATSYAASRASTAAAPAPARHYAQPAAQQQSQSPPRTHSQPAVQQQPSQSPPRAPASTPSSRRALTHALELAQVAVRLDAQNDDPGGAIYAYARSVSLLNHVMNSVMRGDDENLRRRSGRRRSSVSARQDEINRLRAIHDTYADRMRILSEIYNIPLIELTPEEAFNPPADRPQLEPEFTEGVESIGTAMLDPSTAHSPLAERPSSSAHSAPLAVAVPSSDPYANSPTTPTPQQQQQPAPIQHSRASEVPPPRPPPSGPLPSRPGELPIPPSAPPPSGPLPHPPSFVEPDTPPAAGGQWDFMGSRPRAATGASVSSNLGLESLLEEPDTARTLSARTGSGARQQYASASAASYAYDDTPVAQQEPQQQRRHSPPLPPVPQRDSMPPRPSTPHSASQMTPRQSDPQRPNSGNSRARARSGSVRSDAPPLPLPIVGATTGGSISQRRANKPPPLPIASASSVASGGAPPSSSSPSSSEQFQSGAAGAGSVGLGYPSMNAPALRVASSLPPMPHPSNGAVRNRAASQPGQRPSLPPPANSFPLDQSSIPRQPTTPSGLTGIAGRKASYTGSMLAPYGGSPTITQQSSSVSLVLGAAYQLNPCMPLSPLPPPPPSDPLLKPYALMHALRASMTSKTGAYVTRRLHVPHEVWSVAQVGKLQAVQDKVRVLDVLAGALDEVGNAAAEFCGFGAPVADPSRADVERWIQKLEAWAVVCEDVVQNAGKKLGVGEGFVARKSGGWGNRFARSLEKMTSNGKNIDSSGNYVAVLSRLFMSANVLESHTKWFTATPRGAPYGALSPDLVKQVEARLRRSSEFFATVVLTFVIRDLAQLLDRHAKHGEKWLAQ